MNFALAREIYGMEPWCIDAVSFQSLSSLLKNIQNGVQLEIPEIKYNTPSVLVTNQTRMISRDWQLDNNDSFEGIGIINLNGPITKGGGQSSTGMVELASIMTKMAADDRIKGFVINTDSGGGASGAVNIMSDAINEVKKTKPVYAVVSKGGMAGSAAYGIISAANKIFSEDNMNIVGSIGTMIQFSGKPHGNVDRDGEKTITLYASKSTAKNKAYEEAINNDNYELIVNELLDPINEQFLSKTLANRPQLSNTTYDDGRTVFSKDAIGTFIDGIASFDEVVNMVLNDGRGVSRHSPTAKNKIINSKSNNKKMTKQEIKQEHPGVFAEIVSEGVNQERERVASWMAYSSADPEAVAAGIAGGGEIAPSQREQFLIKMHSKSMIDALRSDSAQPITTPESRVSETVEGNAAEIEIKEAFNFNLK